MSQPHVDFDSLSTAEKILHVQDLWDKIAADVSESPLTDAQRACLEERLQDHRENPDSGLSWDEVCDRIRSRK